MGSEIRGEIWIWRLMAWLLCYVLCPALLQSNLKVTLWFLIPQSTGPLIHKLSLSYCILVYVCTNALDWNSFAILDLGGGRAINFADRCRADTIHRDMITILMRNDGSASGLGGGKKPRKELVHCTNSTSRGADNPFFNSRNLLVLFLGTEEWSILASFFL